MGMSDTIGRARRSGGGRWRAPVLFWLVLLSVFEIGVRLWAVRAGGLEGFLLPPAPVTSTIPASDPEIGYLLAPHLDRSHGWGVETAALRILCIGNSNVWGHFVDAESSFPYFLHRVLADSHIEARVVNAGVPGHTSRNIRAHLETRLRRDTWSAVVFTAGWNDLHEASVPAAVRRHAGKGPPPGWMGRVGLIRLADAALEMAIPVLLERDTWVEARFDETEQELMRIVALIRAAGARPYALDLPSGLAPEGGAETHGAAEHVVYPPIRRYSPAGYRALFEALLSRYRGTLTGLGLRPIASGVEYEIPWKEKKYLVMDQCHPGPQGNLLIARTIARLIEDESRKKADR
jgi:lysophospholipase L1-like esterase